MYICLECKCEFENPATIVERHGLSTPPYETLCVCPRCRSSSFEKIEPKYCHYCGAKLKDNQENYCGEPCKIKGEKLRKKELQRQKLLSDSDLFRIVRETENYNKQHRKKYSYGQYTALILPKKKGKKKNGKR